MKMTAKQILEKYDEAEKIVAMDMGDIPRSTRAAMTMRQREAKDSLISLMTEYTNLLRTNAFTIFPQGRSEDVKAFCEIAGAEADTINISAEALYERLATFIEDSLGARKQFGMTQLGLLIDGVTQVARELGLSQLKTPHLDDLATCNTRNDLVQLVRRLVRMSNGDKINCAYIERLVTQRATEIRYTRSVTPVVITDATDEEMESFETLFSGAHFVVPIGPGVNIEKVIEVMTDVRKKLQVFRSTPSPK